MNPPSNTQDIRAQSARTGSNSQMNRAGNDADSKREPSSMQGWSNQMSGSVKQSWGTLTGNRETQMRGQMQKEEGKAEKHMARSAASMDKAEQLAADAIREEGKAERKLGKAYGDEFLKEEGTAKKLHGESQMR